MDSRLALQIALGVLVSLIILVAGLIIYEVTYEAEAQVVETVMIPADDNKVQPNPWASEANREAAIKLVKRKVVKLEEVKDSKKGAAKDGEEEVAPTRVEQLMADKDFIEKKLKLKNVEPVGWTAQWWGDTKYGPQYYLVKYEFKDAYIGVGPTWLVDLKTQKVVAKNVLANVALDPGKGVESGYYDKAAQVVSAITNHRFDSGVNLGGALLLYFAENVSKSEEDTILGWTITHDRGNQFDAYFQWMENGESTYAQFAFDYDRKALRAVNLQAADIMRAGEAVTHTKAVDIMPNSYDADKRAWIGPAKKASTQPRTRARFKALASVLNESELVESFQWLLTGQGTKPEDLERCKETHNCRFMPQQKDKDTYRIIYIFNVDRDKSFDPKNIDPEWVCEYSLNVDEAAKKAKGWASKSQCVAWDVNVKTDTITPIGQTSTLAYRAIHPRI
ncbi:hypothetical protein [Bradymonas sediminis]|uniref:Uncharacterized protein n=1 Tax=Bradymonas sediminis TaxID=1548548 RepID=A0A2Z4FJ41_9DELT|nr:hypothetical protein [Bradymonas sediminis]AWV88835.1 hypothetical protein DN745_05575 [Bradymonas sediminis]TDP71837.1 hypothetical protein DFR33_10851 [Bradymonas sediminis]